MTGIVGGVGYALMQVSQSDKGNEFVEGLQSQGFIPKPRSAGEKHCRAHISKGYVTEDEVAACTIALDQGGSYRSKNARVISLETPVPQYAIWDERSKEIPEDYGERRAREREEAKTTGPIPSRAKAICGAFIVDTGTNLYRLSDVNRTRCNASLVQNGIFTHRGRTVTIPEVLEAKKAQKKQQETAIMTNADKVKAGKARRKSALNTLPPSRIAAMKLDEWRTSDLNPYRGLPDSYSVNAGSNVTVRSTEATMHYNDRYYARQKL